MALLICFNILFTAKRRIKEINRFIIDFELVRLDAKSHHLTVVSVPFDLSKNKTYVAGKDVGAPGD